MNFKPFTWNWLPQVPSQIWILAGGRLLSQIGTGFTLFYAPIFFVQVVGLSATQVGLALGSGSIAGVLGRFLSGTLCDAPWAGRRSTLLLSAAISALADGCFVLAQDGMGLVVGNLLMGLGVGLYWPATETIVADVTTPQQRGEAFALTRVSDSVGLGLGVIVAGFWLQLTHNYRLLFAVDGVSFGLFFVLVFVAIAETRPPIPLMTSRSRPWRTALGDRAFQVFLLANILFTTYLAQIQSTLPLYFSQGDLSNLAPAVQAAGVAPSGFSPALISVLFSWHVVLMAVVQLPVARWLRPWGNVQALRLSAGLWALGWGGVGCLGWAMAQGVVPPGGVSALSLGAFGVLGILALATVSYLPASAALVVDLAPPSQRGLYLALSSQCWAIGYFIGPPLGGWALDQDSALRHGFWFALALSVSLCWGALSWLHQRSGQSERSAQSGQ